jgi:hypothetical protein
MFCRPQNNNQTEARNFRDVLRPQKNDDARSGFARYSEIIKNMVRRTEADLLEYKFDCPIIQLHGTVAFHQSQYKLFLLLHCSHHFLLES